HQAHRGDGAARDARYGQADQRQPEGRHSGRGTLRALVRGGGRQGVRPGGADRARGARAHHARAHGGRRGDRAVELSAAHGGVEIRANSGRRQFAGAQALGEVPAHRDQGGGSGGRGGRTAGRGQRGAGGGAHGGQRGGAAPGSRLD